MSKRIYVLKKDNDVKFFLSESQSEAEYSFKGYTCIKSHSVADWSRNERLYNDIYLKKEKA